MKIRVIDYGYKELGLLPMRAHYNDAGADVFSPIDTIIPAHSSVAIPLKLGLRIPDGFMLCNYPKSGMSKKGICAQIPPIDSGYTGEINAILINVTDKDFPISKGQKVAQLVMTQILLPEFVPEEDMPAQDARGAGAFGSTGI
jgi:dUTP pyrophosphatase